MGLRGMKFDVRIHEVETPLPLQHRVGQTELQIARSYWKEYEFDALSPNLCCKVLESCEVLLEK
jgi:hypothetical protein